MSVILVIYIFGQMSMTAGPFPGIKECQTALIARAMELDQSFARFPNGTGFMSDGRMVRRKHVTMECKFDDRPMPELRGATG
jgi:hypothetical protein